ncbi:hypothetical protein [Crassaminicella indica]|uniref:Uncharacterized protein n=1 Tax=Crassaminicella indica TaxID=2855394 RepID=A0ABX8RGI9_9CLOT|nr:hypothetical protein [Crassaminicella indica]QXM06835.1 hypothetical protein KVH43_03685 [Crassaminicella indica]
MYIDKNKILLISLLLISIISMSILFSFHNSILKSVIFSCAILLVIFIAGYLTNREAIYVKIIGYTMIFLTFGVYVPHAFKYINKYMGMSVGIIIVLGKLLLNIKSK